jgi:hypothetical protein
MDTSAQKTNPHTKNREQNMSPKYKARIQKKTNGKQTQKQNLIKRSRINYLPQSDTYLPPDPKQSLLAQTSTTKTAHPPKSKTPPNKPTQKQAPNPKKNKPKTNQEIKTSNKPHRTTFSPLGISTYQKTISRTRLQSEIQICPIPE